jgi:Flp pilus assembly protein TadG
MRIRKRRIFRDQRGQEIVEFAFMLPLLALLLAGVIEFGRAFYEYNILSKSVRNAARYLSAAVIDSTGAIPATNVTRARNIAVYGNITSSGTPILMGLNTGHISVTSTVAAAGEIYVTVRANYPYQSMFRFLLPTSTFRPKETMIFVGLITYPST